MYNLIGKLNVKENIEVGEYLSEQHLDCMNIDINCQISFLVGSSREYPSDMQSVDVSPANKRVIEGSFYYGIARFFFLKI